MIPVFDPKGRHAEALRRPWYLDSKPTQRPDGTWSQPGPNGYDIRGHDVCLTCGRVRWVDDHPVDLGFIPDRGVCGELREHETCKEVAWDKRADREGLR